MRPVVGRLNGLVESVVPLSARVIGITLRTTVSTSPRALADVALAIARREPGASWPLGTQIQTRYSRADFDTKPEFHLM